ncbi:MAG: DJ-1/PfpI family protein [Lachnospiraceae bacterium]|nr:DJ-1/PfpI family protein [Lachnospiraceae bacterium]
MNNKIAIFFAEGFEEIEALTVVDICRRFGLTIDMISAYNEPAVLGSHEILVKMDKTLAETDFSDYDMLVLPGGGKGTQGLEACEPLMAKVDEFYGAGKWIAAICAAPSIFGHRGILKGRKACSYPTFESHLDGATVTAGPVEVDGNVITSRGMGTSLDFALAIGSVFMGEEAAKAMAAKVVYNK